MFLLVSATLLVLIAGATVHTLAWLLHRVMPGRVHAPTGLMGRAWRGALCVWSQPRAVLGRAGADTLAFAGIVLSVALIQFAMRQCFLLNELLLASGPPVPHWLTQILLDETGTSQYYYFTVLVVGTLLSLGLLLAVKDKEGGSRAGPLSCLLTVLVCIQFLFLPINYGILVFDKVVPRVSGLGGQRELSKCQAECQDGCQEAWLVWEGAVGQTYLVREWGPQGERRLVTLPLRENKVTEIVGYDPILTTLLTNKRCL